MTITAQTSKTGPYNGNGTTTVFSYTFEVQDEAHLVVTVADASGVETTQVLNIDYTVTGVGNANGGQITMAIAPPSGYTLMISRDVPLTQEVDLENRRSVAPEVLEDAYDKLTQIAQDFQEDLSRALRINVSSGQLTDLPAGDRAGQYLAFDALGNPVYASGTGADAALRTDLASSAAGNGSQLISYQNTGVGSTARTVQARLRDFISVKDFGAVGDGVTDDRAAFQSAANTGKPIWVPDGTYAISDYVTLSTGSEFHGSRKAILQSSAQDKAIFYSINIDWFRVSGLTLKGNVASPGSPSLIQNRSPISVDNTADCMIDNCLFEQWHGSGITFSRQGTNGASGKVLNNTFIKGDMTATPTNYGIQDCAPVQIYQYGKDILIQGNEAYGSTLGRFYCAVLVQDQINNGFSRIKDVVIDGNKFYELSQYGFVFYTLTSIVPSSYADNGSGEYRVTCTADHGLVTGDWVTIRQSTGTANGYWQITKISDTVFDLNGSVYAPTSVTGDNVQPAVSCSAVVSNNIVDTIQGDREFVPGNRPYGAGFYIQAAGTIDCTNNIFRRTNLNSNSQTLTPASIGINAATGPVNITGNLIEDCGYEAVSIKQLNAYAPVHVSGVQITGVMNGIAFRVQDGNKVSVENVQIYPGPDSNGGRFITNISTAAKATDVYLKNITFPEYYSLNSSNAFELADIDGFSIVGCSVRNLNPASRSFECLRVNRCDNGVVTGNYMDGKASAYNCARFTDVTNTIIDGNFFRMTPDAAARETVNMNGTCPGTIFTEDNIDGGGRMGNTSTGGQMHTRASTNTSGGKTRQIGDTITNTAPTTGGTSKWVKVAVSAAGLDWENVTITP